MQRQQRDVGQFVTRMATASLTGDHIVWALGAVVVAAGLALRLSFAWLDLDTLTVKILPDDAFYYFVTADRISNGQNITFDSITPSNGYHPLWLFFLVPIYLVPGRSLPLHLALTASSLCDVIAAVLVALAAGRLTGSKVAALFTLTFYLVLPRNVLASVSGVESSLTAMLLGALLLTLVSIRREPRDDWVRWSVLTGVLGGLMVLARLESMLVFAAVLAIIAMLHSGIRRWRAPLVTGAVAAAVIAPWFLWSLVAVGTVIPVSAESTTWSVRERFSVANPDATIIDRVQHGISYTRDVLRTLLPHLYLPAKPFAAVLFAGTAFVGAHFLLFSRGLLRRTTANQLLIAGLPLAAFAVMLLTNCLYRWSVRGWYFAWGMPTVALAIGVAFAYLQAAITSSGWFSGRKMCAVAKRTRGLLLYGALVTFLAAAYAGPARDAWRADSFPFQGGNLQAARYLKANTEPDARVASFNAGVVGYFSERVVINIDGVVNPDAFRALREHRLLEYLRSADVSYAADRDGAWSYLPYFIRPDDWSKSLWGEDPNKAFEIIQTIDQGGGFMPPMRVWRLME